MPGPHDQQRSGGGGQKEPSTGKRPVTEGEITQAKGRQLQNAQAARAARNANDFGGDEPETTAARAKRLATLDPKEPGSKESPAPKAERPVVTATGETPPPPVAPAAAPSGPPGLQVMTAMQKQQLNSSFHDASREAKARSVIGDTRDAAPSPVDDDAPVPKFDGQLAPVELTRKDVWRAIQPPAQSRESRRSGELLLAVIQQFAVGNNPRYEPEDGRSRGHIFVWDVSRAMHCEVPHFIGARELTIGQTVDWIRHEGPMRGWVRSSLDGALESAQAGLLVLALPKDVKVKQIAVVRPEPSLAPDMKPFVASAGKARGNRQKLAEALGVHAAEYFVHP